MPAKDPLRTDPNDPEIDIGDMKWADFFVDVFDVTKPMDQGEY